MQSVIEKSNSKWSRYRRILSLFILVFEGFGIRVLDGVIPSPIILWTGILLLLNMKQLLRLPLRCWFVLLIFSACYTLFSFIKGLSPQVFYYAAWLSAFCVLSNYWVERNKLINDLYYFTKFCVYYNIAHLVVLFFLHDLLIQTDFSMKPSTVLYLFYYNADEGLWGLPRVQGFCWEPSCWNCLINLNIALVFSLRKTWKELIFPIISLVFVFSTTGFMVLLAIVGTYLLRINKNVGWSNKIIVVVFAVIVFPIARSNLSDKLKTGSGATRWGDFYVASYIIKKSPLLGDDIENITKNIHAMDEKEKNWGINGDVEMFSEVGMTNAFAGLFVEYGLFIPLLLFWLFYISPLFPNRETAILVQVCILVVLIGTPIARTGFFYMFPLSTLIFLKKEKNGKDINSNSNI